MAHTAYRVFVARGGAGTTGREQSGQREGLRAVTRRPSRASSGAIGGWRGRSVLRHENDFDAPVLGAALGRRVVGHRLELAERGGGQDGRLDALLLEIAGDVDRARGRQLPVSRVALGEGTDDGLVVRVA